MSSRRTSRLGSLTTGLLDLFVPRRCLGCRARAVPPWCEACSAEVRPAPPGCSRCAAPRRAGHACWPADAPIDATVAAFDYRGPIAASVVTAKLAGATSAWPTLATPLARRLAASPPDVDVITWVTTAPRRVRQRGVDHPAVIARVVAQALQVPTLRLLDARQERDADRYHARVRLPGTSVLLVDDVVTTGATAWRAASVLRRAGAGRVVLAVLARAGSHPLGSSVRDPITEAHTAATLRLPLR